MLDSLDVLIGFALVMLVLSTGVTLLTQMAANLVNLRGRTLRSGIATLLQQIDPTLQQTLAQQISEAVLRHPLIAGPPSWLGTHLPQSFGSGLGTVVSREELVQILLALADPEAPAHLIDADVRNKLTSVLDNAGIADPAAALADIRSLALKLEQAHPDWAAHVRASAATIGAAASHFTATLHASFDNGMERVRDLFVGRARWVTVGCALVVTLAVPVDSVKLLRCLWVDPELRKALVTQGLQTAGQEQAPAADSWADFSKKIGDLRVAIATPDATKGTLDANLTQLQQAAADQEHQARKAAAAPAAPTPGCSADELLTPGRWPHPVGPAVPGLVLTWMMLSLGAPFWFDALKSLAKLRPILAGPEDRERAERASGPPPSAGGASGAASPPPAAGGGEAGDLGATGAAG